MEVKSSSKHIGPFLAFDLAWFTRHQHGLLWLLNTPLICLWFRWVLCIRRELRAERITEIRPNSITYGQRPVWLDGYWQLQQTTQFHTHNKYAKRLYYGFLPLWWGLHWWDWCVADRWLPELSFGFDSLTAYPAAGANSPVDGLVQRGGVNESFATIRAGAGNTNSVTAATIEALLRGSNTSNQFDYLTRGIMCFDTSALGTTASISNAVFSGYGASQSNGLGSDSIHVCGATPAANNTLANSDFSQLGSTSFASIPYGSYQLNAYNDFTLNGNGQAAINKTGITALGWRLGWDLNNSFTGTLSSFASTTIYCRSADQAGTSNDPYLTITYSLVTFTPRMTLLGVP